MSCFDSCCLRPDVVLIGTVTGVGGPVSDIVVQYTVCCQTRTTTTNSSGQFIITVPAGSCVTIELAALIGVSISPESYSIQACHARNNLDFTLTPITGG